MKYIMFIWAFIYIVFGDKGSRTVSLLQGLLIGYRDESEGVFIFYNVPYATAPTGRDKFKAALPAPNWTEIREAVNEKVICPQVKTNLTIDKNPIENCLIANIYVPDSEETNLSVEVIVHGGGYVLGNGEMVQPKQRVKNDNVIAVNFNYRLDIHGFLCLGTEIAPGNAGMKDQVALLRWVRDNIASFGGNPNDVTIVGFSSGSSVVDLLMISKLTTGLFHKVIPESGASLASWSVQMNPIDKAKSYAELLNFTNIKDIHDLEEFYLTTDFEILLSHITERKNGNVKFSPCIERQFNDEVFLDKAPIDILKSGDYPKLPMLYGFSNMEGLFRAFHFDSWKEDMNNNFVEFLPADLQFNSEQERLEVADSVKSFYFGDVGVSDETIEGYINYFTDALIAYHTLKAIKLHVEAGHKEIYLYEYSYVPEFNLPDSMLDAPVVQRTHIRGASHCAQTSITHELVMYKPDHITEEYIKMRSIMREFWSSFTSSGKPSSHNFTNWEPVGADLSPYMSLNMTPQLGETLIKERYQFWDQIYEKHYRAPSAPLPFN